MVKIGILGAAGRMGQMIAREILTTGAKGATLNACIEHKQSWALGKDIGGMLGMEKPAGVNVTTDRNAAFALCDVMIDFTTPEAVIDNAALAHQHQKALVTGTTGLSAEGEAALKSAATRAPVLYSANMSLGVNILLSLVEQISEKLDAENYDVEIFEAHHKHKIDAPSGTALMLGHAVAKGRKVKLDDALVPARFGQIGARPTGAIGMSVFRGGDVIGDHTVTFAGTGERIEISHKASDRSLFAKGAVRAALWAAGRPAGLYTMKDVLGL